MSLFGKKSKPSSGLSTTMNKKKRSLIVHSVIRKGEDHPVFCEDFTTQVDHGRFFLGVVFDGCSGGRESHFASSLYGKIFRQVTEDGAVYGNTIEEKAKDLMKKFVDKLIDVKSTLRLSEGDLLATFMLLMYDKVHGEALVINVGDGLICCDGEVMILENEKFKSSYPDKYQDMPDYIAYEVDDMLLDKSYFDMWYAKYVGKHKFEDPRNIVISTDGILTFNTPEGDIDIINYLFEDEKFINNKIMLSKKVNILRKVHKTVHRDDLSMIRLIIKEEDDNSSSEQE